MNPLSLGSSPLGSNCELSGEVQEGPSVTVEVRQNRTWAAIKAVAAVAIAGLAEYLGIGIMSAVVGANRDVGAVAVFAGYLLATLGLPFLLTPKLRRRYETRYVWTGWDSVQVGAFVSLAVNLLLSPVGLGILGGM